MTCFKHLRTADEHTARMVLSHAMQYNIALAQELVFARGALSALELILDIAEDKTDISNLPYGRKLQNFCHSLKEYLPQIDIEHDLTVMSKLDIDFIIPSDDCWSESLSALQEKAPIGLYVRGDKNLRAHCKKSIAVVGARNCTNYGRELTTEFSAELAMRGFTIVSGGALGVDAAAHFGALDRPNVVFLASGVDKLTPHANARLLKQVAQSGGTVASEYPISAPPAGFRYLERNRLIAGFAGGTCVIEAAYRSGALSTAVHTLELNKPVGAVPGSVHSPVSAGCHRLIREYGADLITCVDDVVEMLTPEITIEDEYKQDGIRGVMLDIIRTLENGSLTHFDVAKKLVISSDDALTFLTTLQLKGYVLKKGAKFCQVKSA